MVASINIPVTAEDIQMIAEVFKTIDNNKLIDSTTTSRCHPDYTPILRLAPTESFLQNFHVIFMTNLSFLRYKGYFKISTRMRSCGGYDHTANELTTGHELLHGVGERIAEGGAVEFVPQSDHRRATYMEATASGAYQLVN